MSPCRAVLFACFSIACLSGCGRDNERNTTGAPVPPPALAREQTHARLLILSNEVGELMARRIIGYEIADSEFERIEAEVRALFKATPSAGDERILIIVPAIKEATGPIQDAHTRHTAVLKAFEDTGGSSGSTIESIDDIDHRLKLLAERAKIGAEREALINDFKPKLAVELGKKDFSADEIERAIPDGFLNRAKQTELADRALVVANRDMLLSLKRNWGKWKRQPAGAIGFTDREALAEYTRLLEAVRAAYKARLDIAQPPQGHK